MSRLAMPPSCSPAHRGVNQGPRVRGGGFFIPWQSVIGCIGLVDAVMVAGRSTLLDQSALDDLLPAATQHGVSFIAAGVFNTAILADPDGRPRCGPISAQAGLVRIAG